MDRDILSTEINKELNILKTKLSLLSINQLLKGEEFWYLTLTNMKHYLDMYNYDESNREAYDKYIKWFISEWPPKKDKAQNYKFPRKNPPPEII